MRVRIYQPAKSAMQSGRGKNKGWLLEAELATARLPEPLMGWLSAGDTYGELKGKLRFATLPDAEAFAAKNGWETLIEPPGTRTVTPKNYLDNFRITRPQDEYPEALARKKTEGKARPAT